MNDSVEDKVHQAQGHKANLSNPNTSEESKENSKAALESLGGESVFYGKSGEDPNTTKDQSRVVSGLKAATKNPNFSEETHKSAQEKLDNL